MKKLTCEQLEKVIAGSGLEGSLDTPEGALTADAATVDSILHDGSFDDKTGTQTADAANAI